MNTQCPKTGRTCEVTGCNGCWKDSMTQDEIIRMAREAGFKLGTSWYGGVSMLERFAALVAAHEREACAKVCDELAKGFNEEADNSRLWCAEAIRARGEK